MRKLSIVITLLFIAFMFNGHIQAIKAFEPVCYNMKKCKKAPDVDASFNYCWEVNLDNDPELEIITAIGYEDGITYSIYDDGFPPSENNLKFTFAPLLYNNSTKNDEYQWGYAWDITDIMLKEQNRALKLLCSFSHNFSAGLEEVYTPSWQKYVPTVFFYGVSTQPDMTIKGIQKLEWLTLDEIAKKSRGSRVEP